MVKARIIKELSQSLLQEDSKAISHNPEIVYSTKGRRTTSNVDVHALHVDDKNGLLRKKAGVDDLIRRRVEQLCVIVRVQLLNAARVTDKVVVGLLQLTR